MASVVALRPLSHHDCVRLLSQGAVGRLAVAAAGDVLLLPVNYLWRDDAILMRTGPDTEVARCAHGARAAFEIDSIDRERWEGWSVVVRGAAEVLGDEQDAGEPLGDLRRLRPWAEGQRDVVVRLPAEQVTGRALGGIGTRW